MIQIFTDTSAALPQELTDRYGLKVIPFPYMVDGEEFFAATDGSFDGKTFYRAMRNGAEVKTSMINAFTYYDAFEAAAKAGDEVIYIGMSSGISGAYNEATVAMNSLREQYPHQRFAAVDTKAAALGEGMPVLIAAKMLADGASFEDIVEELYRRIPHMCQFFTVDDLEYLKRGGRISKISAVLGTVLNVKPILKGDDDGKIVLFHKTRSRKKALDYLAQMYREKQMDPGEPVGIAHGDCAGDAAYLESKLRESGCTGEILTVWYEPVTGSHVGPGTVAMFFWGHER